MVRKRIEGVDIEVEGAARPPAAVSSGARGRPLSDMLARIEARNPELAAQSGLSSAAMRAGTMVREMRKGAGLSQGELAERIGVTQERVSEIERGAGPQGPTFALLERIAAACGWRLAALPAEEAVPATAVAARVLDQDEIDGLLGVAEDQSQSGAAKGAPAPARPRQTRTPS